MKIKLMMLVVSVFIFMQQQIKAQTSFCNTPSTASNWLDDVPDGLLAGDAQYLVRIYIHVLKRTDGGGTYASTTDIDNILATFKS